MIAFFVFLGAVAVGMIYLITKKKKSDTSPATTNDSAGPSGNGGGKSK